jgi:hypothetical protein
MTRRLPVETRTLAATLLEGFASTGRAPAARWLPTRIAAVRADGLDTAQVPSGTDEE